MKKLTIEEMQQRTPKMDRAAVEQQVKEELLGDMQALFWRRSETYDDTGFCPDHRPEPVYECYCTSCHQRFLLPRGKNAEHPKNMERCPRCGARIHPYSWRENRKPDSLAQRFLLYVPLIGADGEVWFRAFRMVWQYGKPEEECLVFWYECGRMRFYDGGAQRWASNWNCWEERKTINSFSRQRSDYGGRYPDAILGFPELENTALEYSQLEAMLAIRRKYDFDLFRYLEMYCKWPVGTERLIKMGLEHWVYGKLTGGGSLFRRLVRMQTNDPKKFFTLSRTEIRHCAAHQISLYTACTYKEMKSKGLAQNKPEDWELAQVLTSTGGLLESEKRVKLPMREVIRYLKKQKKRSGMTYCNLWIDYRDYLGQLKELPPARGTAPDYYPPDLQIAHERLSARLRTAAQRKHISAFRQRRRQLSYTKLSWNHMIMRPIDSPMELVQEGELQKNCVAGYQKRHMEGDTAILVLRQTRNAKKPWYTVEFDEKTNKIRQCRAYQNRDGAPEDQRKRDAFLKKWLEKMAERHPVPEQKRRAM